MTQRTERQLPIARQFRRIHNRLVQGLLFSRRVQLHVLFAWSMTSLARDPESVAASPVTIRHALFRNGFEERRMTFKTSWLDGPAEIQRPISVAGTVDPTTNLG